MYIKSFQFLHLPNDPIANKRGLQYHPPERAEISLELKVMGGIVKIAPCMTELSKKFLWRSISMELGLRTISFSLLQPWGSVTISRGNFTITMPSKVQFQGS